MASVSALLCQAYRPAVESDVKDDGLPPGEARGPRSVSLIANTANR